jgi:signal transduction histidine kinase
VDADALWLETLQQICGRAAHELKGALNGASVNLEVVRSRSTKPDVAASAVASFAAAASEQLDEVIAMSDALLGLSRVGRAPVELALVVRRINALLAPAARVAGKALEVDGSFDDLGSTSADPSAVRAAIGHCLLAATDASSRVRCEPALDEAQPTIRIESCDGASIPLDDDVLAVATGLGIRVQADGAAGSAISISFPR